MLKRRYRLLAACLKVVARTVFAHVLECFSRVSLIYVRLSDVVQRIL